MITLKDLVRAGILVFVGAIAITLLYVQRCNEEPKTVPRAVATIELYGCEKPPTKHQLDDCIYDALDVSKKLNRKVNLLFLFSNGTKLALSIDPSDTFPVIAERARPNLTVE